MISVALLYPGLGLALSECKQWRSSEKASWRALYKSQN